MKIIENIKRRISRQNAALPEDSIAEGSVYASVSEKYRAATLISVVVLAVFLIFAVIFGYKEFTYENIYYFIKDFDEILSSDKYSADSINYGFGENRIYAAYKGGVVAAGKYTAEVYSATGQKTASFNTGYALPVMVTSSKYILLYDAENGDLSVYNSFIRLMNDNVGEKIDFADINDRGDLLVLTSSPEYRSVIRLYGDGFELSAKYNITDYVTSCAMSNDGKYILAATVSASGGEYISSVRLYRRGETDYSELAVKRGELALACGMNAGKCYLITDKSINIIDVDGSTVNSETLTDGCRIMMLSAGENGVAATACDDKGYYIIYVPLNGNTVTTVDLDSRPVALANAGKHIYLMFDQYVSKYDFAKGTFTTEKITSGAVDIAVPTDGHLYLCYTSRAIYIDF